MSGRIRQSDALCCLLNAIGIVYGCEKYAACANGPVSEKPFIYCSSG